MSLTAGEKLWRDTDAAEYLQVCTNTVWAYVDQGMPCVTLSPKVRRFVPNLVREWVLSRHGDVEEGRELAGQEKDQREGQVLLRQKRDSGRDESRRRRWENASAKDAIL